MLNSGDRITYPFTAIRRKLFRKKKASVTTGWMYGNLGLRAILLVRSKQTRPLKEIGLALFDHYDIYANDSDEM